MENGLNFIRKKQFGVFSCDRKSQSNINVFKSDTLSSFLPQDCVCPTFIAPDIPKSQQPHFEAPVYTYMIFIFN